MFAVEKLIIQWAPLVWMAPEEKYMPLGVDEFLENVYIAADNGNPATNAVNVDFSAVSDSKSLFLITRNQLGKYTQICIDFRR